jgi:hypothetical protein
MNSCGFCGDRWPDAEVHNCWVLATNIRQENLQAPMPTDYAILGRPAQTDEEWYESHGHAD